MHARLSREAQEAYQASPYSTLSKDYFARFSRDPDAKPNSDEVALEADWRIVLSAQAHPLSETIAKDLADFLSQRMNLILPIARASVEDIAAGVGKAVVLLDSAAGESPESEAFICAVRQDSIVIRSGSAEGLRDGVVKLVDTIGFRQAPFLPLGEQRYEPRLRVRLGVVPWMGSLRDVVFMGYNAISAGGASLYAVSTSDAIPQLKSRQSPERLQALQKAVAAAQKYGLKTYLLLETRQRFPKDDPLFVAHPEIRGTPTWFADSEYVLCSEHPLVQRFLMESIEGIFRAAPGLDGIIFINGGEGFYHCYMRSFGAAKGRSSCPRCDALGADTVVANLSNNMAAAARRANPKAEVLAWPYSAEHVWSSDRAQSGFIAKLQSGAGIFTEIEKDEYVDKPEGVRKHLWDYSIDLIGPGERAKQQISACKAVGAPIYMKSEPELAFEAPRLSHIPCMDRWADRAEALASCGADGAFVFPAFRPCYGNVTVELNKHLWWTPTASKDEVLMSLATRVAGQAAGQHLRNAWKFVSEAVEWSPELPSYYTGPYYLGPAHPMCVSPTATLPEVFYGYYLFRAEETESEGLKARPTFVTSPTGNVPVFGRFYRQMEGLLQKAVEEIDVAEPLVQDRFRLMFDADCSAIRWFYHTARTEANFYESCQIRDALLAFAAQPEKSQEEIEKHRLSLERWKRILIDERANAETALPVAEADVRLDCYYGSDHSFAHIADMVRAKIQIMGTEIEETLPAIAKQCGL